MADAPAIAVRFNDCINAGDIEALTRLMSEDHVFIDTEGNSVVGKDACIQAWSGFFDAFPGYRNLFDSVVSQGGVVTITGRSICPGHPVLQGPALWTAVVTGELVSRWRVYADTPETRQQLGIPG